LKDENEEYKLNIESANTFLEKQYQETYKLDKEIQNSKIH
jgi:hypothetical protein